MVICSECKNEVESYAKGKRCRDCYNSYMAVYMLSRYHRRRAECIERLGGKCVECGSKDDLEIDHVEPSKKSFNLAAALAGWRWERIDAELLKCELLCKRHHLIKSRRDIAAMLGKREFWEHGTIAGYRYCKCEPCKEAKRVENRKYKAAVKARRVSAVN